MLRAGYGHVGAEERHTKMRISGQFLKHWFLVLIRDNILGLCLVLASATSLIIQGIASRLLDWWYAFPLAFMLAYVFIHIRSVSRLARQTYHAVPLPYSVCLAQSHDWYEAAIRQQEQTLHAAGIAWDDIQRSHRIHRIDWTYFNERRLDLSAVTWKETIKDIVRHFDHLTNRIPIQPVYHFFFAVPGSLAFALGTQIGRRLPMNVYQHAGMVNDPYAVVFSSEKVSRDDGYHLLNKRILDYQLIDFHAVASPPKDNPSGQVQIVLDFTGHDLPRPYPNVGVDKTVCAQLKGEKGHIPLRGNWIGLAHEIASLIFSFVDDDQDVHLIPGIPSSLAFIVGTIVGAIPRVTLYHYNKQDSAYTQGFKLNEL